MALFKKKRVDPAEVAALHVELRALRTRLESAELAKAQLEDQLNALASTTRGQAATIQLEQAALRSKVVEVSGQIEHLEGRIDGAEAEARRATERAETVGARVDSVSVELINQLTELGREIDGLAGQAPSGDAASIDALRSGQVKLAAEQARYEISFRDDLATLAEQVRQLKGRG